MTIREKINDILEKKREGVENFKIFFQPNKRKDVEKIIEDQEYFIGYNNLIVLRIEEPYITIKAIDINAFKEDFYKIFDEFLEKENENDIFKYPEDVKDIINKHNYLEPYYDCVVFEEIKRYLDNKNYRGYKIIVEDGKDKEFIVRKKFIAIYELLFFSKNNKPYVEIKRTSYKATLSIPNSKNYVRRNEDTVVCLYKNLDRFCEINNISDIKDINFVINKNSIKKFYNFNNKFFVNPTKKWVDLWWNYDCPDLYKYTPNIKGTSNMWGLTLICWHNKLVENNWDSVYIDEYITEEEVEKFGNNNYNTRIYKQMANVMKARNMTEEEKEARIKKAEKIEEEIQEIINKNTRGILLNIVRSFSNDEKVEELETCNTEEIHEYISNIEQTFGLDCGFLYMSLTGKDLELFKEISEYDKERFNNGSMKLNYPFNGQSTTIKREMAKYIKEIVEQETEYKLMYWTVLD